MEGSDPSNGLGGFGLRAGGDIDFGIAGVEDFRELEADAGGSAGDEEDLEAASSAYMRE